MARLFLLIAIVLVLVGCAADDEDTLASRTSPAAFESAPEPAATPSSTVTACDDEPCYDAVESLGELGEDVVTEVSGMAASHRVPGLYYVIGDEQGVSEVAVVEEDGTLVGRVEVDGLSARNAEDLAVGPCGPEDDTTCLYIGDIGNHSGLEDLFVFRMPEPDLADLPTRAEADAVRYTYPGDPTDAEALLVDAEGRPIIISKARFDESTGETGPTRVFRGERDGGALEHVTDLDLPAPESPFFAEVVGHVVTAADSVPGRVIVRTYDEIYEYRSETSDADLGTFPDWPARRVPTPFQMQSETVAYRVGECGYLTTSELTGSIDGVSCRS